jgi:ABC-type thiamin/hydroxymethylpyrimidine transport system permease subunit
MTLGGKIFAVPDGTIPTPSSAETGASIVVYQIKSMMGQMAMAMGTTIATLFLQWRTTT